MIIATEKSTERNEKRSVERVRAAFRKRRLLTGVIFFCILAGAFYVRFDNIFVWRTSPERFFFNGTPICMSLDGYYYLGLTRNLLDATYDRVDKKRAVPDGAPNPWPPPLLSFLTYIIAKTTSFSLDWIAVVLPTILGLSLAFPVYAFGNWFGGRAMGLSAAFIALISRYYTRRSALGWYDTDALNVTLVMASCYLFLRFATETKRLRYVYFAAGVIVYTFLCWWWHTAHAVAMLSMLLPIAIALIFYYRPSRKEGLIFFTTLGCLAVILLPWKEIHFASSLENFYSSITKKATSLFPNMALDVMELRGANLEMIVEYSLGSSFGFILACSGICLMIWRHSKDCLFLAFPLAIGGLSLYAERFIIFLAPITGLGVGIIIHHIWSKRRDHYLFAVMAPVILALVAWPNLKKLQVDNRLAPLRYPYHVEAMKAIGQITPPEAVVWADWGHGYPLTYYARRGVIADGSTHSGKHLVVSSLPLAVSEFRLSANWIQFYVNRGMDGLRSAYELFDKDWSRCFIALKKIFSAGPQKAREILRNGYAVPPGEVDRWLRYFFPKDVRPTYLFLDLQKIQTGWFYYGNWNFEQQSGAHYLYLPFQGMREESGLVRGKNLDLDLENGEARYRDKTYPLTHLLVTHFAGGKVKQRRVKEYGRKGDYRFELIARTGFGVLMDNRVSTSIGNQLFVRLNYDPAYFRPILIKTPLYQVWEVKGDSFS